MSIYASWSCGECQMYYAAKITKKSFIFINKLYNSARRKAIFTVSITNTSV